MEKNDKLIGSGCFALMKEYCIFTDSSFVDFCLKSKWFQNKRIGMCSCVIRPIKITSLKPYHYLQFPYIIVGLSDADPQSPTIVRPSGEGSFHLKPFS